MANMDLAYRFTEEKYASKQEVMKDLKTSLVDHIWTNIINYRKQYNIKLNLHTFNGGDYELCSCQFINSKNNQNEMKLLRLMKEASSFAVEDYQGFEFQNNLSILSNVAKCYELDDSEIRMRAILRNEVRSFDDRNSVLLRYVKAMEYLKRHITNQIDISLLHTLHQFFTNEDDTSFRSKNDNDLSNRVVIDRIYTSAPINLIEPLLNELIAFINSNTEVPVTIKSYIAYFYLMMIKPFDEYSDLVATLVAKMILGNESLGEISMLLPLEKLLNDSSDEISRLFIDVQKYNDVTYFVRYGLDFNEAITSELINKLINFKTKVIKEEFYAPEEVEEVKPEVKVEEVKKPLEATPNKGESAINFIPEALDEKEAAKLEQYLLEVDPSLRKGEAKFYARHCTLGKSYTIQQFKKSNRVAYETARTGMDHLVELGYYRKEQVKNKYIYSPVNRRN